MTRAHHVRSCGVVERYSEAMARLKNAGDYALVTRGVPRSVVIACPDGCGETILVNLDRRSGLAWRRYDTAGKLSIYPSVWRDDGCRAHFIVFRDQILWCGSHDTKPITLDQSLNRKVFDALDPVRPRHFESIAESLGAIPWEVSWTCDGLVASGHAVKVAQGTYCRRR